MPPATSGNARAALIDSLNTLLADCFALYLKTKSFHWHVSGAMFRELHLLFDEQAGELLAMTDPLAERVRKLGGATLTSAGALAARSRIADQDRADLSAAAMIAELRDGNRALLAALRGVKAAAGAAADNATEGLVDGWCDQAEGRLWFLGQLLAGSPAETAAR